MGKIQTDGGEKGMCIIEVISVGMYKIRIGDQENIYLVSIEDLWVVGLKGQVGLVC